MNKENLSKKKLSEENPTPAPHPARGIYGFALYIISWCGLVAYLVWAIVPTPLLDRIGITYVPAKYWALAGPLVVLFFINFYVAVIFFLNIIRFRGYDVLNDVEIVENDFGERQGFQGLSAEEARRDLVAKLSS